MSTLRVTVGAEVATRQQLTTIVPSPAPYDAGGVSTSNPTQDDNALSLRSANIRLNILAQILAPCPRRLAPRFFFHLAEPSDFTKMNLHPADSSGEIFIRPQPSALHPLHGYLWHLHPHSPRAKPTIDFFSWSSIKSLPSTAIHNRSCQLGLECKFTAYTTCASGSGVQGRPLTKVLFDR